MLELLIDGRFDPQLVNAEVVGWDDAPEAYGRLTTKTIIVRDAITP